MKADPAPTTHLDSFTRDTTTGPLARSPWANVCSYSVDRGSELESWRRSIAMANPQSDAMTREEAMRLLAELQEVERRLRALKRELRRLADDG